MLSLLYLALQTNQNISPVAGYMSPRISSPYHPGSGGAGGGRGRGRGGAGSGGVRRDRDLIGQTIKITGGPYKGNLTSYLFY